MKHWKVEGCDAKDFRLVRICRLLQMPILTLGKEEVTQLMIAEIHRTD
jgi:hypothetical protein